MQGPAVGPVDPVQGGRAAPDRPPPLMRRRNSSSRGGSQDPTTPRVDNLGMMSRTLVAAHRRRQGDSTFPANATGSALFSISRYSLTASTNSDRFSPR
jgi:hypothetical protein